MMSYWHLSSLFLLSRSASRISMRVVLLFNSILLLLTSSLSYIIYFFSFFSFWSNNLTVYFCSSVNVTIYFFKFEISIFFFSISKLDLSMLVTSVVLSVSNIFNESAKTLYSVGQSTPRRFEVHLKLYCIHLTVPSLYCPVQS